MYSLSKDTNIHTEAILYSYHPIAKAGEETLLIFLGHYEGDLDTQLFAAIISRDDIRTMADELGSISFCKLHREYGTTFSSDTLTISIEVINDDLDVEIVDASPILEGGSLYREKERIVVPFSLRSPVPF